MLNRKYKKPGSNSKSRWIEMFKTIWSWMLPTALNNAVLKKQDYSEIKVEPTITLDYQENEETSYCE